MNNNNDIFTTTTTTNNDTTNNMVPLPCNNSDHKDNITRATGASQDHLYYHHCYY